MGRKLNKERVGMVFTHPKYGEYEIVEYRCALDITIKFKGTGSVVKTRFSHAKLINVRDTEAKSVAGVGVSGGVQGIYNGKMTRSYSVWHGMINRCYNEVVQLSKPTYRGCSVCEGWLYYPNFKMWFDENYIEGYELDKDILFDGNRVYSPSNCLFVPQAQNVLESNRNAMYRVLVSNSVGETQIITNQSQFCRDNKISRGNFNQMLNGKRMTCMGYKLVRKLDTE